MPLLTSIFYNSKFFGKPNGTNAPPKQSKLSFATKSTNNGTPSSSSAKENEDADMEDENSDAEVKPKVKKEEAVDTKENLKPGKGTLSS
jgi:DNA ligase-1